MNFKKLIKSLRFSKGYKLKNKGTNNTLKIDAKINSENPAVIDCKGDNNYIHISNEFSFKNSCKISIIGQNNKIEIGNNFQCNGNFKIVILGSNINIILNQNILVSEALAIYCNGQGENSLVTIGSNSSFYKTIINCPESNSNIIIGDDCMFSYDTHVYNTDGHPIYDKNTGKRINYAKQIQIGNHVWVAWGVTILKNVIIADNIIVGRSAVVSKSLLEEHCVFAGVPARIIKKDIYWEREFAN